MKKKAVISNITAFFFIFTRGSPDGKSRKNRVFKFNFLKR